MKNPLIKILVILGLALGLLLIGKLTAVGEWFNLENISNTIRSTGGWGLLLFSGLFVLGSFLQIPAMVFVLAAILVYGHVEGTLLGYIGVIIAMSVNYVVIRAVGNKVLNEIKHKRVQKLLLKLHKKPLTTVILLRLILWASPILNYTLAMTSVKPKHYIVGSSIGIILPIIIFSGAVYLFRELIIPMVR